METLLTDDKNDFSNLSDTGKVWHKVIFKLGNVGLNLEFFLLFDLLLYKKRKEPNLPHFLLIATSRIKSWVASSMSNDDNHDTKRASRVTCDWSYWVIVFPPQKYIPVPTKMILNIRPGSISFFAIYHYIYIYIYIILSSINRPFRCITTLQCG